MPWSRSRSSPLRAPAAVRPDDPEVPWWRGWRGILPAVLCLALVAGGVTWSVVRGGRCAEGVERRGPQDACVGLTDGGFAFSDDLARVSRLIKEENDRVERESPSSWVSVVYLMRMVPGEGDTNTEASVRHEIQGAHVAQYQANQGKVRGDSPQVRLLLAHTGGSEEERRFTLSRIEEAKERERIVAVAGLGTSTDATEKTARWLTGTAGIPAVGSVLTSDTLKDVEDLVRVAPTNSDQAAAAAHYLARERPGAKVLLVQDRQADDQYSRSLAASFEERFPRRSRVGPAMLYDSSKPSISTYFATQMANLCQAAPDVLFFAGRGTDLAKILVPLSGRHCKDRRLTVLSGDDASQVAQAEHFAELTRALERGNMELIHTGLAHPGAWAVRKESFDPVATAPFDDEEWFKDAFGERDLDDGQAIMGHDAVITAVTAARFAAEGKSGRVTGSDVAQMLTALQGANSVAGASGLINLDASGSPVGKAIPIIRIGHAGRDSTAVAVSSSTGTPPPAGPAR